jgi:hypothetical protein
VNRIGKPGGQRLDGPERGPNYPLNGNSPYRGTVRARPCTSKPRCPSRHAAGYVLANEGTDTRTLQSYFGHRSIQSTVRYTGLALGRFKNLWR